MQGGTYHTQRRELLQEGRYRRGAAAVGASCAAAERSGRGAPDHHMCRRFQNSNKINIPCAMSPRGACN
eukprot:scaffold121834_cov17-Tisochrysis_lutea.AAC.1